MAILVTGGCGYIGSHTVLALERAGREVVILDNLSYGHAELAEAHLKAERIVGDIADRPLVRRILRERSIEAVMHFSAFIAVGESVADPGTYYRNNVAGTLALLEEMRDAGVDQLVFSSTAAVYGVPEVSPLPEDHPTRPQSPYGWTKLMAEQMIRDFGQAHGLRAVIFRYFNAAGADPESRLGEDHSPETHLIPLVLQVALGLRPRISIFGADYPTPDGTCVRDYIHVSDLADAHVLGLDALQRGAPGGVYNLGNGQGYSVREVLDAARRITGHPIPAVDADRRPGDVPTLVGSAARAESELGWRQRYPELETIVSHAWAWHQARHGGAR